jgi:hypothetical protein
VALGEHKGEESAELRDGRFSISKIKSKKVTDMGCGGERRGNRMYKKRQ